MRSFDAPRSDAVSAPSDSDRGPADRGQRRRHCSRGRRVRQWVGSDRVLGPSRLSPKGSFDPCVSQHRRPLRYSGARRAALSRDAATWPSGKPPTTGTRVLIRTGHTVVLDVDHLPHDVLVYPSGHQRFERTRSELENRRWPEQRLQLLVTRTSGSPRTAIPCRPGRGSSSLPPRSG